MRTHEGVVLEALREVLKRPYGYITEETASYAERQSFDTYDPTLPPHPLFNPPPRPEPTFGDYMLHREREERRRYEGVWGQAIVLIQERRFRTRADLAAHFDKPPHWGCELVRLLVKQRRVTAAELRECFPGRPTQKGKRGKKVSGKAAFLSREDIEQVFRGRDPGLNLLLVLAMLRAHTFKSCTGFAAHFFKASYWGRAFGRFLEREGIMSGDEFRACFTDRRGRAGVALQRSRDAHRNRQTTTQQQQQSLLAI